MMKRIWALGIALVMITMAGLAFATSSSEDMKTENGVIGEFKEADKPDTPAKNRSVIIYKEITAYNPESSTVNAPEITFTYTITHSTALAGQNIQDDESHHDPAASSHVLTKEGIGTPTITGTALGQLALSPTVVGDQLKASVNGTANRFPLTVSFANIDFTASPGTGAGVYRYQIDEITTEAIKNQSGIKEGSVANTLYMDVYVDGNGDVYGYVLFTSNTDIDASGDDKNDTTAATAVGKTEGFVGSQPDDGTYESEDASTADKYYTFNLEVKKLVENDTYIQNNHHQFPFYVTLDNPTVTANVLPIMTVGQHATQSSLSSAKIGSASHPTPDATTWTPTIAHDAKITYVGIPCGTTVTVYEENDVAGTSYRETYENADSISEGLNLFYAGTGDKPKSETATINCGSSALTKATENHTGTGKGILTFTNKLLQISPTGIAFRVAPYVLMLVAGVILLVLSRKRKNNGEKA